jgi:hypothetical protein
MFRFYRQRFGCPPRPGFLLGSLLVLVSGLTTCGMLPTAQATSTPAREDISAIFASIERAWSEGDAAAIVERFGRRKVLLRLPDNQQVARRFSHQQSLLILTRHFETHEIRHFSFVRTHIASTERGRSMGLARLTWRRRGMGRTRDGRVLMVLEREDNRWVLTEVQALP